MAEFNYKNAYKLAIQTNKGLHDTLDAQQALLDSLQKELIRCHEEIDDLRQTNQKLENYIDDIERWNAQHPKS